MGAWYENVAFIATSNGVGSARAAEDYDRFCQTRRDRDLVSSFIGLGDDLKRVGCASKYNVSQPFWGKAPYELARLWGIRNERL